jgi:hypothetical protein
MRTSLTRDPNGEDWPEAGNFGARGPWSRAELLLTLAGLIWLLALIFVVVEDEPLRRLFGL